MLALRDKNRNQVPQRHQTPEIDAVLLTEDQRLFCEVLRSFQLSHLKQGNKQYVEANHALLDDSSFERQCDAFLESMTAPAEVPGDYGGRT